VRLILVPSITHGTRDLYLSQALHVVQILSLSHVVNCHAMEIIPEAFSLLYPRAFIVVINSLDSPDNILTNNALYPWGTSVGKDKHGLSIGLGIGSVKFKHERNAIMQHQPVFKLSTQTSTPPCKWCSKSSVMLTMHLKLWGKNWSTFCKRDFELLSTTRSKNFLRKQKGFRDGLSCSTPQKSEETRGNAITQSQSHPIKKNVEFRLEPP